jgi:hypothetical protein
MRREDGASEELAPCGRHGSVFAIADSLPRFSLCALFRFP